MTVANKRPTKWNEIELIKEIGKVVRAYNIIMYPEDSQRKEHILYTAAYPDYVFDMSGQSTPTHSKLICYDIIKKEDGSLGSKRLDSSKRVRPVKMEDRTITVNEGQADEKIQNEEVFAKHYDIVLRFDCMAPSDEESMILIRDFERMLEIHARYLETGSKRFIYNGRRPSYFNRDTKYKSRTCEFFAQVEEHWYTVHDRIDEIEIQYRTRLDVQ